MKLPPLPDRAPPSLREDDVTLLELLDRVLNTGVVVVGDITISVAGVDLVYLSLRALLTSVESAKSLNKLDFNGPTRELAAALTQGDPGEGS
jgi:gas vesicle structural protein